MRHIFVFLPCYNEQEDIAALVEKWIQIDEKWKKAGYKLSVYCIDDKSKDNTNAIVRGLRDKYQDKVFLIEHERNKGLGGALSTAFTTFQQIGISGDICILMDGDNTHDPVYSLNMLSKIQKGKDCVIASRYCNNSKTKGVSPIRLFMSWGARMFYTIILGVKNVKDYTCGYRAYTYDLIDRAICSYGDKLIERRSFACMMEVLYKLFLIGAEFDEIPFELRYDHKQGESKMQIGKTVYESIGTALQLRMHCKKIIKNRPH